LRRLGQQRLALRLDPLPSEPSLDDYEEQAPNGCCSVDIVSNAFEFDTDLFEVIGKFQEPANIASKSIQPPDDQSVAGAELIDRSREARPHAFRIGAIATRLRVCENLFAASFNQCVGLKVEVLIRG